MKESFANTRLIQTAAMQLSELNAPPRDPSCFPTLCSPPLGCGHGAPLLPPISVLFKLVLVPCFRLSTQATKTASHCWCYCP